MSTIAASDVTFASGRYSKRKRTQIVYNLSDLDVSDSESDYDTPQVKIRKVVPRRLPKRQIFPFLQLPAEIRNMIYTYALIDDSGINLMATFKHKRRTVERVCPHLQGRDRINDGLRAEHAPPVPLAPSLLGVSKQVYTEARDILYGNEFICNDTFALYSFLINLGPHGAKYLRKLRLLRWGYGRALKAYNHSSLAVLAWATNLDTFCIATSGYYSRTPKGLADQIYRDGFPWLEALGREKGKPDAALDIIQLREGIFESHRWSDSDLNIIAEGDKKLEEFQDALRKQLGAQQKRMLAKPSKRRKLGSGVVSDEL